MLRAYNWSRMAHRQIIPHSPTCLNDGTWHRRRKDLASIPAAWLIEINSRHCWVQALYVADIQKQVHLTLTWTNIDGKPTMNVLVGGLVAIFYFPIYWESHHPNWRSPSFFRGVAQPPTRCGSFFQMHAVPRNSGGVLLPRWCCCVPGGTAPDCCFIGFLLDTLFVIVAGRQKNINGVFSEKIHLLNVEGVIYMCNIIKY